MSEVISIVKGHYLFFDNNLLFFSARLLAVSVSFSGDTAFFSSFFHLAIQPQFRYD